MELTDLLRKSFLNFFITGDFFSSWYQGKNKSYYFTFKENLSKTNIQYGELKSLLFSNIKDTFNTYTQNVEIQILTVHELNASIKSLTSSFTFDINKYRKLSDMDRSNPYHELVVECNKIIELLSTNYIDILSRTIIIDALYNSCCIYLPSNLSINILDIISKSGYLNTCGELIYMKNFKKAKKSEFILSLKDKLADFTTKVDFNVFSYEDFSHTMNTGCDIENLKIHIDKYYFDGTPLITLLFELEEVLCDQLQISFFYDQGMHKKQNKCSIWLVKDTSIGSEIKHLGENKYFICYLQQYKNENQLHIFDEHKPAWKSNTTIPHTLMAAMINIALEGIDKMSETCIIDPFCGTGTTILELLKYESSFHLKMYGSDIDLLNKIMLRDNLHILSLSEKKLHALIVQIEENRELNYSKALDEVNEYILFKDQEQDELEVLKNKISGFENLSIEARLHIYVYFKVRITDQSYLARNNRQFKVHYLKEIEKLLFRLRELLKILETQPDNMQEIPKGFKLLKGRFSSKVIIDPIIFKNSLSKFSSKMNDIAMTRDFKSLEKNKYDIIICDPPYGFNASLKVSELIQLYNDLPIALVSSLKPNGQIVMSLPDESFSGKHSPWFTHKDMVITSFHFAAKKLERRMFNYSEIHPRKELFKAPFYWEAQRALRRSIVHFKFT